MNLAAFNLFLGVMSFKQTGLDTDGSSGLPCDVRDVDVFGTPL